MLPSSTFPRRSFLGQAAAAPFFIPRLFSAPPASKLRLAAFGADGMAFETLHGIATHPNVTLVCAAEVDSARLTRLKQRYPEARVYADWRQMLNKEKRNLDLACIGTPDHMHAPQAMASMRQGLHVYVQKPLTHDIFETRRLTEMARNKRLVSQMGIQIHSNSEYRTAVQLIQAGAIGKIREVHSWSNKKWGDPNPLPERSDPVPASLNWDLWIGVAPSVPYLNGYYHPGNWRRRTAFGTATFGDMGCHIFDPVYAALELRAPLSVRSEGPAPSAHSWAVNAIVRYVFPGTRHTADKTLKVTWYDGDERPPKEIQALAATARFPTQGSLFVGADGVMLLPHIGQPVLLPEARFKAYPVTKADARNHYHEFVDAVLGKTSASTAFDYSGPLTEAVLLGPLATHFPNTTLEWNAAKLKFRNSKEATRLVRRKYRNGWKVRGL